MAIPLVVNKRGLWYDSMPNNYVNSNVHHTRFPAFVCDWDTNCRESDFTTFTQYVYYIDSEGRWLQSSLDANVDQFVSLCKVFTW